MNETNVNPILSIHDLYVDYNSQSSLSLPWEKKQIINAVNGVSFNLHEGKTLGIVGETGCGKSTIAKAIIKLTSVKSGQIFWMGNNLLDLNKKQMQKVRKEIQMIFQDPLASLNPRMNIGEIVSEPLKTHFPTLNHNQVDICKIWSNILDGKKLIKFKQTANAKSPKRNSNDFSRSTCFP